MLRWSRISQFITLSFGCVRWKTRWKLAILRCEWVSGCRKTMGKLMSSEWISVVNDGWFDSHGIITFGFECFAVAKKDDSGCADERYATVVSFVISGWHCVRLWFASKLLNVEIQFWPSFLRIRFDLIINILIEKIFFPNVHLRSIGGKCQKGKFE